MYILNMINYTTGKSNELANENITTTTIHMENHFYSESKNEVRTYICLFSQVFREAFHDSGITFIPCSLLTFK